ncbi:hypothetical protein ABVT39_019251 [Epinephelus coioides]
MSENPKKQPRKASEASGAGPAGPPQPPRRSEEGKKAKRSIRRKEKLVILLELKVFLQREIQTVTSAKTVKNLTDYIKDLIQVKHFQHRLDTPSVQEMSKEQWN